MVHIQHIQLLLQERVWLVPLAKHTRDFDLLCSGMPTPRDDCDGRFEPLLFVRLSKHSFDNSMMDMTEQQRYQEYVMLHVLLCPILPLNE